jgi:O-antigen ligase
MDAQPVALAGGAIIIIGLAALAATGWIAGTTLVAISLPLPALYSTDSLRVATAAPVTAAVIGAWLLTLGAAGRHARTGRSPRNALALLFATFAVATVTAQHVLTSMRETVNFALLLGFLFVAIDAFTDRRALPRLVSVLVSIAALCGILAVLEAARVLPGEFPRWETSYNRAALGFGQPNGLGLFFAIMVPFAVHRFRIERDRVVRAMCAAAIVCVAAGLVATFSRGSWLSILAGTGALFFTGDRRLVGRIWIGVLITAIVVDVGTGGAIRDTITRTIGDWVIEQRAALMYAGILMFAAYPITGVGPGGYAESLDRFGPLLPQLWDYLPTPHNAYVQMAAEAGLLGLCAYIALLVITLMLQIRRTRREDSDAAVTAEERSLNRALLWSFATACAAGMVVWPFAHGTGQAVMLVLAGIYAAPLRPALRVLQSGAGA